jgi:ribosomal protein S18 acetylase RimI-like enzyme
VIDVARARACDLNDALRVLTAYFDAIELAPELRDMPDDVAAYLREPRGMWLARCAGEVVGVIALWPLATIAAACEIKRLYVDPGSRGGGIADALLDALEAAAIAQGYRIAYLDTRVDLRAAIAFYRRRGYENCERYNDNPEATNFMCRRLPCGE